MEAKQAAILRNVEKLAGTVFRESLSPLRMKLAQSVEFFEFLY